MPTGLENPPQDEIISTEIRDEYVPQFIKKVNDLSENYPEETRELLKLSEYYYIDRGLKIPNRNALIDYVAQSEKDVTLISTDIKNLRKWDLAGRGDEVLEEVVSKMKGHPIFRYGGDEFVFVLENIKPEEKEKFAKFVEESINEIVIEGERIELKNGVENFNFPTEVDAYKEPSGVSNHPKVVKMRELAAIMGLDEEFKDFEENLVNDKLLGSHVANLSEFSDEHLMEPFEQIHVFEAMGLKETNDNLSFNQGDELIVNMWDQITENLGEDITNNVRVFRRGGTIVLCEKSGLDLTEEQRSKLANIKILNVGGNKFPVAKMGAALSKSEDSTEVGTMLKKVFQNTKKVWIAQQLSEHKDDLENFLANEDIPNLKDIKVTDENFFKLWLHGKRYKERLALVEEVRKELNL